MILANAVFNDKETLVLGMTAELIADLLARKVLLNRERCGPNFPEDLQILLVLGSDDDDVSDKIRVLSRISKEDWAEKKDKSALYDEIATEVTDAPTRSEG